MKNLGVTIVLIAVESLDMAANTLFKSSTSKGMSPYVFITYSTTLALLLLLLPMTLIVHRHRRPPAIGSSVLLGIFALSLIRWGIKYSSSTLASAIQDLIPAFTFILAIVCSLGKNGRFLMNTGHGRMEKLDFKRQSSQAKSVGTVISICGALLVTLYRGLPLIGGEVSNGSVLSPSSDWIKGGFLIALSSFGVAGLYVVKTWIAKQYPAKLVVMSINSCFVSTISFGVALIAERNSKSWVPTSNMLISVLYSAIVAVTVRNIVNLWACGLKGPVFVSIFKPLGMVIAFALGIVFLGDTLYLSSLIGAAVIAIGFYAVIWGQAQQDKMEGKSSCFTSSSSSPLLENNTTEYVC